jgi:hypothetical protein
MNRGVVLTNVKTLDQLDDCVRRGGYDTVKVVSEWGVDGGWNRVNKATVLKMVPNVIVRTVTGDPSINLQGRKDFHYVDPNRLRAEISDWYSIRQDITIELGNEPNVIKMSITEIYEWVYNLKRSIDVARNYFPQARLIAPAMMLDRPDAEDFLRLGQKTMSLCDSIGFHCYEYFGWEPGLAAYTNTYREGVRLYSKYFLDKPWYITEFGINDKKTPPEQKGARYADFMRWLHPNVIGAVYYHLNIDKTIQPEYHIYPGGDLAFHNRRYV